MVKRWQHCIMEFSIADYYACRCWEFISVLSISMCYSTPFYWMYVKLNQMYFARVLFSHILIALFLLLVDPWRRLLAFRNPGMLSVLSLLAVSETSLIHKLSHHNEVISLNWYGFLPHFKEVCIQCDNSPLTCRTHCISRVESNTSLWLS